MAKGTITGDVVSNRTLNRTLLERHMLLRRTRMPSFEAIEYLLGLQGQEQLPPYLALWSRLEDFDPQELSQLLADRRAVRGTVMRGTVHFLSVRDFQVLRPLMQPVLERMLKGGPWMRGLQGVDMAALAAAGRAILEEQPLTTKALGEALQPLWPDNDGRSLAYAVPTLTPLVHLPPRGLWRGVGQTTLTTSSAWLGEPVDASPSIDEIMLRYLRVFGPASVMDAQAWCGLTRLKEVFERLRPRLRTYRDENGRELFDLTESTLADPDLPAPVRFMPVYDNLMLAHADRTRFVEDVLRKRMVAANGFFATFMVDGYVRGRWQIEREKKRATLVVWPFRDPLSKPEMAAVEEEGRSMLDFVAEEEERDFRFLDPEI